jgi:hypothetical protein
LVLEWLALTPRERQPYLLQSAYNPPVPTDEQVNRVLAPFQTEQERNIAFLANRESPVWLRTCYAPDLAQNRISQTELDGIVNYRNILDDEALYGGLAGDWRQIYFRVPSLPDVVRIYGDPDPPDDTIPDDQCNEPEEEYQRPLYEAERLERNFLYLLDEEALREKVVKVMWLDVHGKCVWDFKIRDLDDFQGPLHRGLFVSEIIGRYPYSSRPEKWVRGALLD